MSIEAMKLALEALKQIDEAMPFPVAKFAMQQLRQAIEQAEQAQPVAWRWKERINNDFDSWVIGASEPPPYAVEEQPLYTAPQRRKWMGLEPDEWIALGCKTSEEISLVLRAQAKLKEKNA